MCLFFSLKNFYWIYSPVMRILWVCLLCAHKLIRRHLHSHQLFLFLPLPLLQLPPQTKEQTNILLEVKSSYSVTSRKGQWDKVWRNEMASFMDKQICLKHRDKTVWSASSVSILLLTDILMLAVLSLLVLYFPPLGHIIWFGLSAELDCMTYT